MRLFCGTRGKGSGWDPPSQGPRYLPPPLPGEGDPKSNGRKKFGGRDPRPQTKPIPMCGGCQAKEAHEEAGGTTWETHRIADPDAPLLQSNFFGRRVFGVLQSSKFKILN